MFEISTNYLPCGMPHFGVQKLLALYGQSSSRFPACLTPSLLKFPRATVPEIKMPQRGVAGPACNPGNNTPSFTQNQLSWLVDVIPEFIDALPDAIFLKDNEGRWLLANTAARTLFQLDGIAWQGKTSQELIALLPSMRDKLNLFTDDKSIWKAGKLMVTEEQLCDNSQAPAEYEIYKSPQIRSNGKPNALVVVCRNVTAGKHAEHELRIADTAIESQEAIIISDADNNILRVNKAFTRLTGYSAEEVIGKKPSILESSRHDKAFYQAMQDSLAQHQYWEGEIWDRRKNGELYPKWVTITGVTKPSGQLTNYVSAFTDISEHKEAQEAIHRLAFYDPLTNLPNRRLLNDRLQMALTASSHSQYFGAVLLIDLDHFKTINDSKGHEIGDELLVKVAARLQSCVRQNDTVSRLGGDEFIVLLENLSTDANHAITQAEAIGEKVLHAINQPYSLSGNELYSSPSIGICLFNGDSVSSGEILKCADTAMYQAKNADRNTLRFFDPELQSLLEKRLVMKSELYHALSEEQFRLYYQIQINSSGTVFGAEALLRWEHPERGLVFPNDFISLAEETGLILPIGDWVLQAACQQLKRWENNPLTENLTVAVNVSPLQFRQPKFVEQLKQILEQTAANPKHLELELTESMVISDITDTVKKMEQLGRLGIKFSMDDFGTGYSSLSCLKKLPFSQLKIDQSFVRDIVTDPCDAEIVQTILGMAHTLGLNVIAEGVENEKQYSSLESRGCPAYQGYLFGQASPAHEFEKLIEKIIHLQIVRTESDCFRSAV